MASEPKLTSDFWVQAYRARLDLHNIPAFMRHKGDPTAGAVLVKLNTLDGAATAFQRGFAMEGARGWDILIQGDDKEVEEAITRQRSFDPDLWVIEIESALGETLLDEPGLRE